MIVVGEVRIRLVILFVFGYWLFEVFYVVWVGVWEILDFVCYCFFVVVVYFEYIGIGIWVWCFFLGVDYFRGYMEWFDCGLVVWSVECVVDII